MNKELNIGDEIHVYFLGKLSHKVWINRLTKTQAICYPYRFKRHFTGQVELIGKVPLFTEFKLVSPGI